MPLCAMSYNFSKNYKIILQQIFFFMGNINHNNSLPHNYNGFIATIHKFCIKSLILVIVSPGQLKIESVKKSSKMLSLFLIILNKHKFVHMVAKVVIS